MDTAQRERCLAGVLDEIVPPGEGGLPGAGELGLASTIGQIPELAELLEQGLSALDEVATRRGADDYAALPQPERLSALNEVAAAQPVFLPGLMFQTYLAYYQHARVVEALGMPPRPPFPLGYEMQPSDLDSLLGQVRQRGKLYRE
jgi:hypothetical protein